MLAYILLSTLFPQEHITILVEDDTENAYRKFEHEFVRRIFQLVEKRTGGSFTLDYVIIPSFGQIFTTLDSIAKTDKKHHVMAVSKLSITEERKQKYDFSTPYMTNKYGILALKHSQITAENLFRKKRVLTYTSESIYDPIAKELSETYPIRLDGRKRTADCVEALRSGVADVFLTDYVEQWIYDFKCVQVVSEEIDDHIGIMYPKKSLLKNRLAKIIKYYTTSAQFYQLVREYFGNEGIQFYKLKSH